MTTNNNINLTDTNFRLQYHSENTSCAENNSYHTEILYPLSHKANYSAVEKCLAQNSLLHLKGDHSGERLTSVNGVIWITQSNNLEDIFLCTGESFDITQKGSLVIQAMDEIRLKISSIPGSHKVGLSFRSAVQHMFNHFL
ncbi:MAG: hypothetical protein CVU39_12740 [Chloroflexi bacterium HGW-Chloroflexi-10]|nr:MAG: hypothetical protein CVU39_12740 [Chloroflexi bacterium HGW-Chloroflexi-10]